MQFNCEALQLFSRLAIIFSHIVTAVYSRQYTYRMLAWKSITNIIITSWRHLALQVHTSSTSPIINCVLVIWCHRLLLHSTLQQHQNICNIKYHLHVEVWEHALLRDSLLLLDMSSMDLLQYNHCQRFPSGLLFSLWAMHCVHSMILHSIRVSLFRIILAISPTDEVQSLDGFFLYLCCSHPFNTTDMLNIHSSISH